MSGVAPIKPEFLRRMPKFQHDDQPSHQNAETGVQNSGECNKTAVGSGNNEESPIQANDIGTANSQKRKCEEKRKTRGQNKKRPRPQRPKEAERLCLSVKDGEGLNVCQYGDKCRFEHDLKKYWETKQPDIADRCPNYEMFGKCDFGFSCRFAAVHVNTTSWTNVEDPSKVTQERKGVEMNSLAKELQKKLRHRQYDFQRSNEIVATYNSAKKLANADAENGAAVLNKTDPQLEAIGGEDTVGAVAFAKERRVPPRIRWDGQLYLAPLTTVGNLPFRRICKEFGAEITCGEMAMAYELLEGRSSEWALVKRHPSERIFGVQLCGNHADVMTKCAQLLTEQLEIDFIDINMGCPIDLVCGRGAGCSLMTRQNKLEQIVRCMGQVMPEDVALTVKLRTGFYESKSTAHLLVPKLADMGVSLFTLHGRSREQRYTKLPDWRYICQCANAAAPLPCFGCGDVLSYEEYYQHMNDLLEATTTTERPGSVGVMIARGALIKPWIFTEIKERRHWDISANERLDILKRYVDYGLQHWGSDEQGVNNTRRFLLEWLSFLHRYIPVGILERVPQKINERPPYFVGRNDLETMMASNNCADWIKISEMLLGPVPAGFSFLPKHKANSYQSS